MKSLIPYVGSDDNVRTKMKLIGFDKTPNRNSRTFTEAAIIERQKFLNIVYENYDATNLTESQAMHLTSLVERSNDLLDIAVDYIDFCESTGNDLDVDGINITVYGEKVMPLKTIIESFSRDSIYEIPNRGVSEWNKTTKVGVAMEHAMQTLYTELENYKNYQESFFDMYESALNLDEVPPMQSLMCECINADAVKGVITLEDAAIEKGFVLNAFNEFEVGAMAPVVPLTGSDDQPNIKDESILDLNRKNDAEIDADQKIEISADNAYEYATESMIESGFFSFYEAAVPKNNLEFDNEVRKLFSKISKCLKLANPEDETASFKACLNISKTQYNFAFNDNPPMQEDQIRSALLLLKWVPNKLNNKIVDYSKELGNMHLKLEFPDMQSGIKVSFTIDAAPAKPAATTESFMEAIESLKEDRSAASLEAVRDAWYEYVSDADIDYLSQRCTMLEHVCEKINTVITATVPTETSEISCIDESCTMDYLLTELTNNSNDTLYNCTINALEYVVDGNPSHLENLETVYESVIDSRYACQVVLNSIEMMEADDEEIDEDIKSTIDLLNKLGYKTKYSCSGHNRTRIEEDGKRDGVYRGKLYTTARITFDKKYDFREIPKGWYQNPNADVTSIYVEPLRYNDKYGSPDEAFKKWKDGYMTSLKSWAENLDKSSSHNLEESFDELKNEVDGFANYIMESHKENPLKTFENTLKSIDNFGNSLL